MIRFRQENLLHKLTILLHLLNFVDSKNNHRQRCAAPKSLHTQLLEKNHSGPLAGHFSGEKLWWWPGMLADVTKHYSACPQCAIVNGSGHVNKPPLNPIPVQRVFQIIGVDVMDLPLTESGNHM